MKKLLISSLIALSLFATIGVIKASAQSISLPQLIELLILAGVIAPEKADIARQAVGIPVKASISPVVASSTPNMTTPTSTVSYATTSSGVSASSPVNTPVVQIKTMEAPTLSFSAQTITETGTTMTASVSGTTWAKTLIDISKPLAGGGTSLFKQYVYPNKSETYNFDPVTYGTYTGKYTVYSKAGKVLNEQPISITIGQ